MSRTHAYALQHAQRLREHAGATPIDPQDLQAIVDQLRTAADAGDETATGLLCAISLARSVDGWPMPSED